MRERKEKDDLAQSLLIIAQCFVESKKLQRDFKQLGNPCSFFTPNIQFTALIFVLICL